MLAQTDGGAENEERNSRSISLSPCHCIGKSPFKRAIPAELIVDNVKSSRTGPAPHGEVEAARKDALLYLLKQVLFVRLPIDDCIPAGRACWVFC